MDDDPVSFILEEASHDTVRIRADRNEAIDAGEWFTLIPPAQPQAPTGDQCGSHGREQSIHCGEAFELSQRIAHTDCDRN